jgi:hypothetical protein
MIHVDAYVWTNTTSWVKCVRIIATKQDDRAPVGGLLGIADREVVDRKCIVVEMDMITSCDSRGVHKLKSVLRVQSDAAGVECAATGSGRYNHYAVASRTVRIETGEIPRKKYFINNN